MNDPYIKINTILSVLLMGIFVYSFYFQQLSDRGIVVPSTCDELPAMYCNSRGLSRAFSAIMHGKAEEAKKLNRYSPSVFGFFAAQFFARIVFSCLFIWKRRTELMYADIILSIVYFLVAFAPLVSN